MSSRKSSTWTWRTASTSPRMQTAMCATSTSFTASSSTRGACTEGTTTPSSGRTESSGSSSTTRRSPRWTPPRLWRSSSGGTSRSHPPLSGCRRGRARGGRAEAPRRVPRPRRTRCSASTPGTAARTCWCTCGRRTGTTWCAKWGGRMWRSTCGRAWTRSSSRRSDGGGRRWRPTFTPPSAWPPTAGCPLRSASTATLIFSTLSTRTSLRTGCRSPWFLPSSSSSSNGRWGCPWPSSATGCGPTA
mmetsp:Transcript_7052/g.19991  ORF Transcript_7052/g.19991 Transcript_7052/m.19991 type:complete len:245 (-) Transcript_7052:1595-2329(-)